MDTTTLAHDHEGTTLEAHLALPDGDGARPAVLVWHAFGGQGDFERARAARLAAELGVVGAAMDLYGRGVRARSLAEAQALMAPFVADRARLRARLRAGLAAVRGHPRVDAARVAAIGFCFGGMCALDLARSGADVRGVVAFHGLLAPPLGLDAPPVRARVLVLSGSEDPFAPAEQRLALERELAAAGAGWEVHVYGGVKHSFTNPAAADAARGTVYDAVADRRSWAAMRGFLEEVL